MEYLECVEPADRIHRYRRWEQSKRAIQRRRTTHRWSWGCDTWEECQWCQIGATHPWFKGHNICGCHRRRTGQPRIAGGMCRDGSRDRIYHWRNQARELNRVLVRHHANPDMDSVALLLWEVPLS